jgi:hypothetical protein
VRASPKLSSFFSASTPPSHPPPNQSHRVLRRRERVAGRDHVRVREAHVRVAIGVRFDQIAELDALLADRRFVGREKRLRRQGRLRQRLLVAIFGRHVPAGTQTLARLVVRNDRGAREPERLVRAGLIAVPMRVDDGGNLAVAAGELPQARDYGVLVRGGAAVDDD